jgi:hypothetical protein
MSAITTPGAEPASAAPTALTSSPPGAARRTAHATGAWYLGLALFGAIGFMVLRPQLYAADPVETVANLAARPGLAHTAVLLELLVVLTQALAAVWFYALLRPLRPVAAFATAAFGLVNAVAIMMSAAFMAAANTVVASPALAGDDAAGKVGLLQELSSTSWDVGGVFFGLWLIPMGWAAITTRRFPVTLGWVLVVGGVGYVLGAVLGLGVAGMPAAASDAMAYPATVGELWMVGYLLVKGIRPTAR